MTRKRTIFTKKRYGRDRAGLVSTRAGANIEKMSVLLNGADISDDRLNENSFESGRLNKGRRGVGLIMTDAFFVSGGGASGPFASVENDRGA